MRPVSLAKSGLTAAIALIALVLVIGMIPGMAGHAAPRTAAVAPAAVHPPAQVHPPATGPITITTAFTSTFSTNALPYFTLPYNITWNVNVVNTTISHVGNTIPFFYQQLNVTWLVSGCGPFTFPCLPIFSSPINPNWETAATATSGSFYFPLSLANLTASTWLGFDLPQGQWQFSIYDNYDDGAGNASHFEVDQAAFMAVTGPSGSISQPTAGENITAGHTVIAGEYSGYFIATANVTVYNASGSTVLIEPVYAPGPQQHAWAVPWAALTPGTYKISLTLTAAWHLAYYANTSVTVLAGVPLTYENSTGLQIAGLGAGGSAVVLVVLGTVIGMVVMAVVGRSLWGGAKPSPAQPWSPQSSSSTSSDTSGGMSGGGSSGGSGGMGNQNPPS